MKKKSFGICDLSLYVCILSVFLIMPLIGNHAITAFSENISAPATTIIIDPGHGGVDGGAISCTGVYESHINLEIALRLNDMMHLFGIPTVLIRDSDISVYTSGETIAAKKVSDLKERIRIVNSTPNALLLSIHQNNFTDSRYSGAQVFYNNYSESKVLAEVFQSALRQNMDPNNKRQPKPAQKVFLMDHINCTGILMECGFISNREEEVLLRTPAYQKKLCAVITATTCRYLNT